MVTRLLLGQLAAILVLALAAPAPSSAAPVPLALEGILEVVIAEDLEVGAVAYEYHVVSGAERVRLRFAGEVPDGFVNGATVRIRGRVGPDGVFAADGGSTAGAVLVSAPEWSGPRRLAVVLVNFTNDRSRPFSRSFVNGVIFSNRNSVRAYFAEQSYGEMVLGGTTFDWLKLPLSSSTCDYRGWESAARAGLSARGVDVSAYTNLMLVMPPTKSCAWRGLGYLPGPTSWINGRPNLRTPAHELGHNFGVHHASSLRCTADGVRVALSRRCTREEYGDPFTTMGASYSLHDHGLARVQMGYLPASATRTVTASGTYTLSRAFSSGGLRVLGIPRGNGTSLYLEYRRPYGTYFDAFSTTSSLARGVTIRLAGGWTQITQSGLVDTVPATRSFEDAPLRVGRTFRDRVTGITVTVTAAGRWSATVVVRLPRDTTPPSAPGGLEATQVTLDRVSLAWGAATDNRSVAGYRVYRDGALIGATGSTVRSLVAMGLVPGTEYAFAVRAVDAAGNLGPASNLRVRTETPDAPPSSVEAGLVPVNDKWASLTWTAATDDRGVASYVVYRDGAVLAVLDAAIRELRVPAGGTYAVAAIDNGGQVGPLSNPVGGA